MPMLNLRRRHVEGRAYDSSFKKNIICDRLRPISRAPQVQYNGFLKIKVGKEWVTEFEAKHMTTLHPTTPLHFMHYTLLTSLHHHHSTELLYSAIPVLHCTASTTLHPHYSTALHPLNCTLYSCELTTLHYHYSTALHCYSTSRCSALECNSSAMHAISLYCMVQCYRLHFFSLHFTGSLLHCSSLHGAMHFTTLQWLHSIIMYFTALHSIPRAAHAVAVWTVVKYIIP